MSLLDRILRRNSPPEQPAAPVYTWKSTGDGLLFTLPGNKGKTPAFEESYAAYQHTVLQMLLEAGEAAQDDPWPGIHVDNETLCRLDEVSRAILGLPGSWPGKFELDIFGIPSSSDFSLTLYLKPEQGLEAFPAILRSPFLSADGQKYLPDAAQWRALEAVAAHSALPPSERTETANLKTIYALQNAQKNGLDIALRYFDDLDVEEAERVGVSAIENPDGSIRLVPAFGLGLSPDEPELSPDAIEARLGQLDGKADTAVLRVGEKLVLLNEERLKAVREILTSRVISARDKRRFFKTPGAFLDATLVDLDMGFALRVKGVTVFQKAYFGYSESDSLEWFEESGQEAPSIIPLEDCLSLLENEKELDELRGLGLDALQEPRWSVEFKEKTVLLPKTLEEFERIIAELREKLLKKREKEKRKISPIGVPGRPGANGALVVDIWLNDIEADWGKTLPGTMPFPPYTEPLPTANWKYTPES